MAQSVLILGGGVGGLVAANVLRKKLPKLCSVTLVEREANFVFAPSFLWIITGDRTREKISRPLDRLSRKGIRVIRGEIEAFDPDRRVARVGGNEVSGDYVVLALGAELAPEAIPGLAGAGHNFYSLEGAESLRDAVLNFDGFGIFPSIR
jgi:sulfide:quinone oxidoreductase